MKAESGEPASKRSASQAELVKAAGIETARFESTLLLTYWTGYRIVSDTFESWANQSVPPLRQAGVLSSIAGGFGKCPVYIREGAQ